MAEKCALSNGKMSLKGPRRIAKLDSSGRRSTSTRYDLLGTFGLAFGYIMLAEVVNAKAGLGFIIIQSQRIGPREHIFLCLIIISLLAWGIDRLIMLLQRHLFPHLKHGQT